MPSTASMVEINGLTTALDSATGICFPANKRSVAAPLPVYRHGISFFRENLRKTIDSTWNEWTEGNYLEPDEENGFGYLEAYKKVFVK